MIEARPASAVASKQVAKSVETVRPIVISWPGEAPQAVKRLLITVPPITESELAPKIKPYWVGLRPRTLMKNSAEPAI